LLDNLQTSIELAGWLYLGSFFKDILRPHFGILFILVSISGFGTHPYIWHKTVFTTDHSINDAVIPCSGVLISSIPSDACSSALGTSTEGLSFCVLSLAIIVCFSIVPFAFFYGWVRNGRFLSSVKYLWSFLWLVFHGHLASGFCSRRQGFA